MESCETIDGNYSTYHELQFEDLALCFNVMMGLATKYGIDLSDCLFVEEWVARFSLPEGKYSQQVIDDFKQEIAQIIGI